MTLPQVACKKTNLFTASNSTTFYEKVTNRNNWIDLFFFGEVSDEHYKKVQGSIHMVKNFFNTSVFSNIRSTM